MTPKQRSPFDLHPAAVVGAVSAGRPEAGRASVDAEPEPVTERISVQRRLLAVLTRRLDSQAARGRAGRAYPS